MDLSSVLRYAIEFLSVLAFYLVPFCGAFQLGVYILYKLLFTPLWPLVPLYLGWTFLFDLNTPKQGGRRAASFMKNLPLFKFIRDYYSMTLEKTADLDPSRNYIFGYHPHGLIAIGAVVGFQTEALQFNQKYPGITSHMSVLSCLLKAILYRDILMSLGIVEVSRDSLEHILTAMGPGQSVVIIVGGGAEVAETGYQDFYCLTMKRRKGFIKLALQTGSDLVPVFGFGQNNMCTQLGGPGSWYWRAQHWLYDKTRQYGFPITCCCCLPFVFPWRTPINIVVGNPIRVSKTPNPTQDQIDELQATYIDKLQELFNTYKVKYNLQHSKLMLI
ncbi:diacylglycerol O-acyltransferase 2 [Exaiptasia diaphana]|uniref:Acyltransferase n=1 Tax=Exaiptasia diaphana TaxID=2652724 RepID=A0A913XMV8_EXADI|nr:diacylglycerol O-acyltransferase 2 [Exaiptasia diaphana]KXJ25513.1 Diacylglycerol O-acyltransferase 2 [Exaiptasia diaphana]